MLRPTVGRIVHYVLDSYDDVRDHAVGQIAPAIVVSVWSETCVNLIVFLDGANHGYDQARHPDKPGGVENVPAINRWVTSACYSEDGAPRTWHWPPREDAPVLIKGRALDFPKDFKFEPGAAYPMSDPTGGAFTSDFAKDILAASAATEQLNPAEEPRVSAAIAISEAQEIEAGKREAKGSIEEFSRIAGRPYTDEERAVMYGEAAKPEAKAEQLEPSNIANVAPQE